MRVYQVWVLADDLEYANKFQQDLCETKMLETEIKEVATWFATHYQFAYVENSVIRVEEVEIDNNGDEQCIDVVLEMPLLKEN